MLCLGSCLDSLKTVFSDEWGYELDYLTVHSKRSSSKAGKAFCCLNSSCLAPQVPSLNRASDFALQTLGSALPPLGLCAAGTQSFQELSLDNSQEPFWSDEAGRHSLPLIRL